MADDLMEALTALCATCDGSREVAWCPSWAAYLCAFSRANRADAEFRVKLPAGGADVAW